MTIQNNNLQAELENMDKVDNKKQDVGTITVWPEGWFLQVEVKHQLSWIEFAFAPNANPARIISVHEHPNPVSEKILIE